jgi:hypothetical protein
LSASRRRWTMARIGAISDALTLFFPVAESAVLTQGLFVMPSVFVCRRWRPWDPAAFRPVVRRSQMPHSRATGRRVRAARDHAGKGRTHAAVHGRPAGSPLTICSRGLAVKATKSGNDSPSSHCLLCPSVCSSVLESVRLHGIQAVRQRPTFRSCCVLG